MPNKEVSLVRHLVNYFSHLGAHIKSLALMAVVFVVAWIAVFAWWILIWTGMLGVIFFIYTRFYDFFVKRWMAKVRKEKYFGELDEEDVGP